MLNRTFFEIKKNIQALVISFLPFMLVACGNATGYSVTAKVVDRHCRPIPNHTLLLVEQVPSNVPYGGGSTHINKIKSDKQGYSSFSVNRRSTDIKIYEPSGRKKLHEMQLVSVIDDGKGWGITYHQGEKIIVRYFDQFKKTTKNNPLYLHVMQDSIRPEKEAYHHHLIKMPFTKRIQRYLPSTMGMTSGKIVLMQWYLKDEEAYLDVYGVRDGGVLEIRDTDDLLSPIPVSGFQKRITYRLADGHLKKSLYLRGDKPGVYGVFSFDLLYDDSLKTAYATLYTHTVVRDKQKRHKIQQAVDNDTSANVVLPIETCSGVLSRSPNGYYTVLNDQFLKYLKGHAPLITAESSARQARMDVAANPDTPLDWFEKNITSIQKPESRYGQSDADYRRKSGQMQALAEASLNNNGEIEERIEYLYDVAKSNGWSRLIKRIAEDRRTATELLNKILVQTGDAYLTQIISNPNTDDAVLHRMLEHLDQQSMGNPNWTLKPFVSHPNASPDTLERVWEVYIKQPKKSPVCNSLVTDFLQNPRLSKKLLGKLAAAISDLRDNTFCYRLAVTHPAANDVIKKRIRADIAARWDELQKMTGYKDLETLKQIKSGMEPGKYRASHQASNLRKKRKLSDRQMAGDPATSPKELERLFHQSESGEVIKLLAANPSTPNDILHMISSGNFLVTGQMTTDYWISLSLFCNPAFDSKAKRYLSYHLPERCKDI